MDKKSRLAELLETLRDGGVVTLGCDELCLDYLTFAEGRWSRTDYSGAYRIRRDEALAELRALIERERRDAADRAAEIAWLDQAIAEVGS